MTARQVALTSLTGTSGHRRMGLKTSVLTLSGHSGLAQHQNLSTYLLA